MKVSEEDKLVGPLKRANDAFNNIGSNTVSIINEICTNVRHSFAGCIHHVKIRQP
jgi:hypothetical protein